MLVIKSKNYHLHTPEYELYDEEKVYFPEIPERVDAILAACHKLGLQIETVEKTDVSAILRLHSERYVEHLRKKCEELKKKGITQVIPSEFIGDTHSPLTPDTYKVAVEAANVAAVSVAYLLKKKDDLIYALCRPPGHHAEYRSMRGSCYFNNAALAANLLAGHGKVAVLDLDYHHGNGTQNFFYDRDDILFVSIHAHPNAEYPFTDGFADEQGVGKGKGYNLNLPLSPRSSERDYLETLHVAIKKLHSFEPKFIVLSLGFDTYKDDPLGGFGLDVASYSNIGRILSGARGVTPMLIVQEGGYAIDSLSSIAENFITGITRTAPA